MEISHSVEGFYFRMTIVNKFIANSWAYSSPSSHRQWIYNCVLSFPVAYWGRTASVCGLYLRHSVWPVICSWLGVQYAESLSIKDHFRWFGKICKERKAKKTKYLIWLTVCWSIWLSRNGLVFRNEEANIDAVIKRINSSSWSWLIYRRMVILICVLPTGGLNHLST